MRHVEAYSRLAGVYDEIVIDPCHDQWASFLHELWSADPDGVRSVLDLCCGTGLLAGELIARGYRVVGVDASDAMMNFTIANPNVAGTSAGNDFVISSIVDPSARTCDTRIELTRPRDGDPFSEQHRQYFHTDADVRASLHDAGFAVTAVGEEYTHQPADASTLRATWTARRLPT